MGFISLVLALSQAKRNLSQLPNFALSVPLALFHASRSADSADSQPDSSRGVGACQLEESNARLQEALIMFPNVLLPLMDKCQVTLDPTVMKHPYFNTWNLNRSKFNMMSSLQWGGP